MKIIKNTKLNTFFVWAILLVGLFARTWNLSSYPTHMSMDEVAIGYNAYSIGETGRDEWGKFMPLAFESVGDYKPPVNIYLAVPTVKLFGMTEFAVRFPTALLGALSVLFVMFIMHQLKFSKSASYFAGLWLALSPWHIHFSRASFEAITALFFLLAGFYYWLLWMEEIKNSKLQFLSSLAFGLSVWSYHAERAFVPLFVVGLIIIYREKFMGHMKYTKVFLVTSLLLAIPFIYLTMFTPAISQRAASTSIFRERSLVLSLENDSEGGLGATINKAHIVFRHWFGKFSNYLDLRFWFRKGLYFTSPGYPDMGLFYLVNAPFIALGLGALMRGKKNKVKSLAVLLFFLGLLPASITMNEQHPLRALTWMPFFMLVLASGFSWFVEKYNNWKKILVLLYTPLLFINIVYFILIYTIHFPYYQSEAWQYGYKEISVFACENKDKYDNIFVSESFGTVEYFTGVPQLYLAFYCDGTPLSYIFGQNPTGIHVKRPDWKHDQFSYKNTVFIATPWDFPIESIPEERIIKRLYLPNGKLAFIFVFID